MRKAKRIEQRYFQNIYLILQNRFAKIVATTKTLCVSRFWEVIVFLADLALFQLTTLHLMVSLAILVLVGGTAAMVALLFKSQFEEALEGKFL